MQGAAKFGLLCIRRAAAKIDTQGFEIGPVSRKNLNKSARYKMLLMKMTKPLR